MKWIVGGEWNDNDVNAHPDLQIWRPMGDSTYRRVHSTTISAAVQRINDVYETVVSPPIPFRPGDILGVFQPESGKSRLQVDYDSGGRSVNFYTTTQSDQLVPAENTIDINNDQDLIIDMTLPLVSIEIGELVHKKIQEARGITMALHISLFLRVLSTMVCCRPSNGDTCCLVTLVHMAVFVCDAIKSHCHHYSLYNEHKNKHTLIVLFTCLNSAVQ